MYTLTNNENAQGIYIKIHTSIIFISDVNHEEYEIREYKIVLHNIIHVYSFIRNF